MKRFQLKKYIAGAAIKQSYGTILSGSASTLLSGSPVEVRSDVYIAGQQGNILTTPVVSADSTFYNIGYFERQYSVQNPDIIDDGVGLDVLATNSDITDIQQFGDYAFNLTNETSLGTQYALESTPSGNLYREPHTIVTYDPNQVSAGVIDLVIGNIPFNITDETPDVVYGILSGSTIVLYATTSVVSATSLYSIPSGIPNSLPFAYLLEQPLNYSASFSREGIAYGGTSGDITFLYSPVALSGDTVYSPYPDQDNTNKIYVNPFKLKNMYNYNWNAEYDRTREVMTGVRDYQRVGAGNGSLWLSYKYFRENSSLVQDFDLVERVKGLYKFKQTDGHKSNIYSIRIKNSGLNEGFENEEIKLQLREIIEETVLNACKRIAPTNTQLWKITWSGI